MGKAALHHVAENGHIDVLRDLLRFGAGAGFASAFDSIDLVTLLRCPHIVVGAVGALDLRGCH